MLRIGLYQTSRQPRARAGRGKGNVALLVIGQVISVPRIITIGAGLLGWVAGEMAVSDPAVQAFTAQHHALHTLAPALGAVLVIATGKWLVARARIESVSPA